MNIRTLLLLATLIAATGLLGACGDGDDGPDGEEFDGGTLVVDVQRDEENDQSRKLMAIADGQKGVEQTAEECVEEFRVEDNLTQCWVFADQETFDNAGVDIDAGTMSRNCWDAYAVFINGDLQTSKQTEGVRESLNCDRPVEGETFTNEDDVPDDENADEEEAGDSPEEDAPADGDDS